MGDHDEKIEKKERRGTKRERQRERQRERDRKRERDRERTVKRNIADRHHRQERVAQLNLRGHDDGFGFGAERVRDLQT